MSAVRVAAHSPTRQNIEVQGCYQVRRRLPCQGRVGRHKPPPTTLLCPRRRRRYALARYNDLPLWTLCCIAMPRNRAITVEPIAETWPGAAFYRVLAVLRERCRARHPPIFDEVSQGSVRRWRRANRQCGPISRVWAYHRRRPRWAPMGPRRRDEPGVTADPVTGRALYRESLAMRGAVPGPLTRRSIPNWPRVAHLAADWPTGAPPRSVAGERVGSPPAPSSGSPVRDYDSALRRHRSLCRFFRRCWRAESQPPPVEAGYLVRPHRRDIARTIEAAPARCATCARHSLPTRGTAERRGNDSGPREVFISSGCLNLPTKLARVLSPPRHVGAFSLRPQASQPPYRALTRVALPAP